MKNLWLLFLIFVISGCSRLRTESDFQIGMLENQVNEIYAPRRPEVILERNNVKVGRYQLWDGAIIGQTQPYFFTFTKTKISEEEILSFAKEAGVTDQNFLDYIRLVFDGTNFYLAEKALDQATIDRMALQGAAAAQTVLQSILSRPKPKTYYMYRMGTGSYMIKEGQ